MLASLWMPDYSPTTPRLHHDYIRRGQDEITVRLHSGYTRGQRLHPDYTYPNYTLTTLEVSDYPATTLEVMIKP